MTCLPTSQTWMAWMEQVDNDAPEPGPAPLICFHCGTAMVHLGKLPRRPLRATTQVFRCFSCDNVVIDPPL